MGSSITVDKHVTNIEEWLEVTNKLDTIDFQGEINSHLGLWRITEDNKNQLQTNPVQIQKETLTKLFARNECYVMYGIKKSSHQNPQAQQLLLPTQLSLSVQNLKNNIVKSCYMTPMKISCIQGHEYRLYALFGKKSKSKQRLLATSNTLKLNDLFNSIKKLSIISGGGVLRNKKLQKGSVLPFQSLFQNQSLGAVNSNVIKLDNREFSDIDIIKFYSPNQVGNSQLKKLRSQPLSILSFRSESALPEIKTQKIESLTSSIHFPSSSSMNFPSSSSMNYHSSSNIDENSIVQQTPQEVKPIKKSGLQKMNLKLDFSKPLNLGGLNLASKNQQTSAKSSNQVYQSSTGLTNRSQQRRGKREKCEQQCSQVIEGLYVSGEKVAKNYDSLQKHQIKYIINCAGDYCENWFENKGIEYLTFFLKDSQNQNIQCLFYRVIDFIQNAHKNKENVLIHCIQGISRSVTFVIAYIIFKYGYDYKKAESFVKQKRSIACPNNGFMVELIQFHKRLYDEYESLTKPRVFLVSSHSKETPHILTARMLKNSLFDTRKYVGLDSRTVYIIHLPELIYIWVGSKCDEQKLQTYWTFANDFVKKLQKYQRAPLKVKAISQGSEQKDFLSIWSLLQPPKLYSNSQYDRLFLEGQPARPGLQRQFYEQIEEEEMESKKLFIYPDYKTGLGVFSLEDLNGMCILTIINEQKGHKNLSLHIWRDERFEAEENCSDEEFLSKVIETNYSSFDDESIQIMEEDYEKPSQVFKDAFLN